MIPPPALECIENRPIEQLVEYPRNPRKNDSAVDRMCGSIREFGFKVLCVIRRDGVADGKIGPHGSKNEGQRELGARASADRGRNDGPLESIVRGS
jgi:hypothetical protein